MTPSENNIYMSRAAAKGIILARLEELAGIHSISYNKVFIKNQKTRWGSCSAKKNLNFNYKIALLPKHLMDYVLLHELVHIKHLNHSRQFWDELNRLTVDDAASLDKQLKEFSALLV
jgi:predicted metal-dependent hydrolase